MVEELEQYKGMMIKANYLEWGDLAFITGVLARIGKKYLFVKTPQGYETKITKSGFGVEEVFNGESWEQVKDE